MDDLLNLVLKVEKKPGLYIGKKDLECLGHFLYGYYFAKREEDSDFGVWYYFYFREYLAEKYRDKRTLNVTGLIIENEESGNSADTFDIFFRLLHEYLEKHVV